MFKFPNQENKGLYENPLATMKNENLVFDSEIIRVNANFIEKLRDINSKSYEVIIEKKMLNKLKDLKKQEN